MYLVGGVNGETDEQVFEKPAHWVVLEENKKGTILLIDLNCTYEHRGLPVRYSFVNSNISTFISFQGHVEVNQR